MDVLLNILLAAAGAGIGYATSGLFATLKSKLTKSIVFRTMNGKSEEMILSDGDADVRTLIREYLEYETKIREITKRAAREIDAGAEIVEQLSGVDFLINSGKNIGVEAKISIPSAKNLRRLIERSRNSGNFENLLIVTKSTPSFSVPDVLQSVGARGIVSVISGSNEAEVERNMKTEIGRMLGVRQTSAI